MHHARCKSLLPVSDCKRCVCCVLFFCGSSSSPFISFIRLQSVWEFSSVVEQRSPKPYVMSSILIAPVSPDEGWVDAPMCTHRPSGTGEEVNKNPVPKLIYRGNCIDLVNTLSKRRYKYQDVSLKTVMAESCWG